MNQEATKDVLQTLKEEKLYNKPWFWVCIVLIVYCITRPHINVMMGNNADCNAHGNMQKDNRTEKNHTENGN